MWQNAIDFDETRAQGCQTLADWLASRLGGASRSWSWIWARAPASLNGAWPWRRRRPRGGPAPAAAAAPASWPVDRRRLFGRRTRPTPSRRRKPNANRPASKRRARSSSVSNPSPVRANQPIRLDFGTLCKWAPSSRSSRSPRWSISRTVWTFGRYANEDHLQSPTSHHPLPHLTFFISSTLICKFLDRLLARAPSSTWSFHFLSFFSFSSTNVTRSARNPRNPPFFSKFFRFVFFFCSRQHKVSFCCVSGVWLTP